MASDLIKFGKVSLKHAEIYRSMALRDHNLHTEADPEFYYGGGRAVDRHG